MKKRTVFVLILCVLLSLCPSALATGQGLSEEAPVFSGVYTMMLGFGSFTVLEACFTKKVPMVYMPDTWEKGEDGNYHAAGSLNPTYTVAKDGSVAFAIKGVLHNGSSDSVNTDELHPVICDNGGEQISMYGYPVVPVSEPDKTILYPGRDMKTVFACTVPTSLYYGDEDILLSFQDASLCFPKEDLESFVSMGFGKGDGAPADDVTKLLADDSKTREEKPAVNLDFFDFSNIRILSAEKWNKPGKYIMDFDFTCLYPESDAEQYPNTFNLLFSFLDAESVAVKTGQLQVNSMISYGDKVRASSCPHFNASENIITPEELSEIKYVKFTGFTTWTQGTGVKNYKFQDSPVFPLQ